jgi:hypothetical protein
VSYISATHCNWVVLCLCPSVCHASCKYVQHNILTVGALILPLCTCLASINNEQEAVIQCSLKPLCWDDVEKNFIQEIQLGTDFDILFVTFPIILIVHPLCVIPDCGGQDNKHFVVLPKRNWSRFFGNLINRST